MIDNFELILSEVKTVGISGHVRPDGDCVGSCMAMYNYLTSYYPTLEVSVILEEIPHVFDFLANTDKIQRAESIPQNKLFDLYIALDCSDGSRLGSAEVFFKNAKTTICIDHHFGKPGFADYNYIIPDDSSTCELVYNQLPKDRITLPIAECLYTGIIHDTGVFQYSCTTADTMSCAGKLMSLGVNFPKICDDTYYAKTMTQNRVMGYVLSNCKSFMDGKIVAAVLTSDEMKTFDAKPKHLEGIVQQLRCTTGVEVAVFLYQLENGEFKGSTRSTGDVDLTLVTGHFGGGGHKKAAGFSVEANDPWSVIDEVIAEVKKQFITLGIQ
ncbi:MAG: DHH family phosphoesterase [Pseudobutyrivibrio sp.]|nr:DHH family phosphoesterase [Pseudobutyrivibrio sp.]